MQHANTLKTIPFEYVFLNLFLLYLRKKNFAIILFSLNLCMLKHLYSLSFD